MARESTQRALEIFVNVKDSRADPILATGIRKLCECLDRPVIHGL